MECFRRNRPQIHIAQVSVRSTTDITLVILISKAHTQNFLLQRNINNKSESNFLQITAYY